MVWETLHCEMQGKAALSKEVVPEVDLKVQWNGIIKQLKKLLYSLKMEVNQYLSAVIKSKMSF